MTYFLGFLGYYAACLVLAVPALRIARPANGVECMAAIFLAPLIVVRWALHQWQSYMLVAATVAVVSALSGCSGEYDDNVAQSGEYCEMVQLWKDTQGRSGWPAFRGESECADAGGAQ